MTSAEVERERAARVSEVSVFMVRKIESIGRGARLFGITSRGEGEVRRRGR